MKCLNHACVVKMTIVFRRWQAFIGKANAPHGTLASSLWFLRRLSLQGLGEVCSKYYMYIAEYRMIQFYGI